MKRKFTFLGTGTSQGIPVIGCQCLVCQSSNPKNKRLRVAGLVSYGVNRLLIDAGPDFRQQMLQAKVSKIDGIIYTHKHSDHTAGLDDIRPFTQRYGDLPIFASKQVIDNLKERFAYIFTTKNKYPSAPSVIINTIENKPFKLGNITVRPIAVKHGDLDIFGYRFDNLAYLTDVSFINKAEKEKLHNLEVLIINALQIKEHFTHFNLEQALNLIDEVKPNSLVPIALH